MRTSNRSHEPIEPVYRQFGAKVEQIRHIMGMTQQDLATKLEMSRGSVANIELGRQRILLGDVDRFATALNSTPKFLMKGIWI